MPKCHRIDENKANLLHPDGRFTLKDEFEAWAERLSDRCGCLFAGIERTDDDEALSYCHVEFVEGLDEECCLSAMLDALCGTLERMGHPSLVPTKGMTAVCGLPFWPRVRAAWMVVRGVRV